MQAEQQRIEVMQRAADSTVAIFDSTGRRWWLGRDHLRGWLCTDQLSRDSAPCGAAMKCGLNDGEVYDAVIVGIDPVGDVAVIQICWGVTTFPVAELGR